MALAAAQVIDALATRLAAVGLSAGRVYTDRLWPLTESELPAWRVTAAAESIAPSTDGLLERHDLTVMASGYVKAASAIDDSMHALAAAGLLAVHGTQAATFSVNTTGIDRQVVGDGEASMGQITLQMLATFYTNRSDPETLI